MIPESIDRYKIHEEIGRGGMAVVLKGYDPRFGRQVAIKLLPREFLHDPQFSNRFQREAQTIASLEHPAIVPVHDYGNADGQLYLVMRLMAGGSLADRLKKGPLSITAAAGIFARLAPALDSAHSLGIIHRDLKPGNILFDQWDNPYLSDFGIAKIIAGSNTALTVTGGLVGTPAYMSPEQVKGVETVDGRSDIYAMGVILFQMLTGKLPYNANTPIGLAFMHVNEPVPNILEMNRSLPDAYQAVINQAMAKEREMRPKTTVRLSDTISGLAEQARAASVDGVQTIVEPLAERNDSDQLHSLETQSTLETEVLSAAEALRDIKSKPQIPNQSRPATKDSPENGNKSNAPIFQRLPAWAWITGGLALLVVLVFGGISLFGGSKEPADRVEQPTTSGLAAANVTDIPDLAETSVTPTVIATNTPVPTATQISAIQPGTTPTHTPSPTSTLEPSRTPTNTPPPTSAVESIAPLTCSAPSSVLSPKDGMTMVCVPEGEFLMGAAESDTAAEEKERPQHQVYLDAFWIYQTEVTNAMYAKCVASNQCTEPHEHPDLSVMPYEQEEMANHPVVFVTWVQANEYCEWAGMRLPTEAEWEKAARGTDGRIYPWGNAAPDATLVNLTGATTEVGSFPGGASPYGALDMAGNVFEVVSDWYDESYYSESILVNPQGPASGNDHAMRGGSFVSDYPDLRTTARTYTSEHYIFGGGGFRCVTP